MKLWRNQTLVSPQTTQDFRSKVTALCYTRDNKFLGVATSDRLISIYDEQGNRVDKFNTKPNNKGPKDYIVRSIQFGPEVHSPKLVVGQTDCIVFVYKWSTSTNDDTEKVWGGKKSICNKFVETSPIVSVVWPDNNPSQCVYALMEGKIKIGNLRTNQSQLLYSIQSRAVSLALNSTATELLSGHSDGAIYKFTFPTKSCKATCSKIVTHSHPPYLLCWGQSICVADSVMTFYGIDGSEQIIGEADDLSRDERSNGYTMTCASPNGYSIAAGSFDTFSLFVWDPLAQRWGKSVTRSVENMCSVTAFTWAWNGSGIALGTSTGLLDTYNAAYRQYIYKGAYEITHVSLSEVLVHDKKTPNSSPIMLSSSHGEIVKVKIYRCPETNNELRYLIAKTKGSLILCDLKSSRSIQAFEIEWYAGDDHQEKFIFDAPEACIISHAGELTIVEYGERKVLGSIRTEYHTSHLISLRLSEDSKIAYLLDKQTISIRNLQTRTSFNIYHNVPLDFLELSDKGHHIIFRDKKRNLYIFDNIIKRKAHLLNTCGYAQWVPSSDVVVAQSKTMMHVWYNVKETEQVNLREIQGDIIGIERHSGKSEVMVESDSSALKYHLSEDFIQYGDALDAKRFGQCVNILEKLDDCAQVQAMWSQLLDASLESWDLCVAERCAAALQNSSLARFISNLGQPGASEWKIYAKICELKGDIDGAEGIYLSHNRPKEAILMYENLEMFSDVVRIMSKAKDPDMDEKKHIYLQRLIESGQHEKTAEMREEEGDFTQAITLYLRGGLPERAANVCLRQNILQPRTLLNEVTSALDATGLYEISGDLYTHISCYDESIICYMKGHFFQKAVAIAIDHSAPGQLKCIYKQWAETSIHKAQYEEAVEQYIQGSLYNEALDAAIKSQLYDKAVVIAQMIEDGQCSSELKELASHLISRQNYQDAEKILTKTGNWLEAANMYRRQERWEDALRVAKSIGGQDASERISYEYGIRLGEDCKNLDPQIMNDCLSFCVKNNDFENAIFLAKHSKSDDFVQKLVLKHAQILEDEETEYLEANAPHDAIDMHIHTQSWVDAERVATMYKETDLEKVKVAHANYALERQEFSTANEILDDIGKSETTKSRNIPQQIGEEQYEYTENPVQVSGDRAPSLIDLSVWETVQENSSKEITNNTVIRLEKLDNVMDAISLLKRGAPVPAFQSHYEFYLKMTCKLLALSEETKNRNERSVDYLMMLDALGEIIRDSFDQEDGTNADNGETNVKETASMMNHLQMTIHYTQRMILCIKHHLNELACKCAITLMRYSVIFLGNGKVYTLIPADKAFYQAGILCRDEGFMSLSFIFLNHYIDHVEAMEENDGSFLSNEDFKNTVIPFTGDIATDHCISENKREEIRDWILGSCIDSKIDRNLPKPRSIQGDIHEGLYEFDAPQCMITGYPIANGDVIQQGEQMASKKDHDFYVEKTGQSPWM